MVLFQIFFGFFPKNLLNFFLDIFGSLTGGRQAGGGGRVGSWMLLRINASHPLGLSSHMTVKRAGKRSLLLSHLVDFLLPTMMTEQSDDT